MNKYYLISGYWKDTGENVEDLVVTSASYTEDQIEFLDDIIFMYDMNESEIKSLMWEDVENDFVITSYKELDLSTVVRMDLSIKFPNGFDNWCETFYEVANQIEKYSEIDTSLAYELMEEMGRGGLYELTKEITDDLEYDFKVLQENPPEDYNGDWFEYVEKFIENKMFNYE